MEEIDLIASQAKPVATSLQDQGNQNLNQNQDQKTRGTQQSSKNPHHNPSHIGFLVHLWTLGKSIRFTGRLLSGESFAGIITRPTKLWFERAGELPNPKSQVDPTESLNPPESLNPTNPSFQNPPTRPESLSSPDRWTDFSGNSYIRTDRFSPTAIPSGLILVDEFFLSRGIRGMVEIQGSWQPGRRVQRVFRDPELQAHPDQDSLALVWLSLDIETDRQGRVVAVSLVQKGSGPTKELVLFLPENPDLPRESELVQNPKPQPSNRPGESPVPDQLSPDIPSNPSVPTQPVPIQPVNSERALLQALSQTILQWDPDVITGWNVVDFDFRVLEKRYKDLSLAFDLGRAEDQITELRQTPSGLTRVVIPGRQVVDGMKIFRGSGQRFEDQSLETTAQGVLGRGKLVEATGEQKMAELVRLRKEDPLTFCQYALEDARLVLDILEATGLDRLTESRAGLTGLSVDLAWTSIPAFEQIYNMELLQQRIIPPAKDLDREVSGAAGGTVLEPIPGYFHWVTVFDFRSLYPSIMRTFNIDPLVYHRTDQSSVPTPGVSTDGSPKSLSPGPNQPQDPPDIDDFLLAKEQGIILAPNWARFHQEPGILPRLIESYFSARQRALDQGDPVGSHVYKILMNSFYGVLGSGGCVYGRSELAGAITGFGKLCLHFARDFFQRQGLTVLYGDTDSVFIYASGNPLPRPAEDLAQELNRALDLFILEHFGRESKIQIRFDTCYQRFLLPKLRGPGTKTVNDLGDSESQIRGRAKGYAGLKANTPSESFSDQSSSSESTLQVEIKGMEAARSDYTSLAQTYQRQLLDLLFNDRSFTEMEEYTRNLLIHMQSGKLDDQLVYKKVLRRPARDYQGTPPPQVRAAKLLGWTHQRGKITYVMTLDGPQPVQKQTAPLDYNHYRDHQLRPIWESLVESAALGDRYSKTGIRLWDTGEYTGGNPFDDQLELGFS